MRGLKPTTHSRRRSGTIHTGDENERDALRIEKAQLATDLAESRRRIAELETLTLAGRIAKAEREAEQAEAVAKAKRAEVERLRK